MVEVIAFHETLPGHHVAAALGLPDGAFNSGYAEGWALYAEYLADEMDLYSGPLDRAGMIAKHLWAASRLVVEPGLHLHGWTRDQAVRFMRTHTALTDAEIAVEVDRYIATPGQSLSYMLGYDRIAGARRYAERALGARFDLRRFHDVVLRPGARPLDRVHADVVRWADQGGGPFSSETIGFFRGDFAYGFEQSRFAGCWLDMSPEARAEFERRQPDAAQAGPRGGFRYEIAFEGRREESQGPPNGGFGHMQLSRCRYLAVRLLDSRLVLPPPDSLLPME